MRNRVRHLHGLLDCFLSQGQYSFPWQTPFYSSDRLRLVQRKLAAQRELERRLPHPFLRSD